MNEYVNYKKYITRQESLNEAEFAAFPKKDEYPGIDPQEPQISPTARPTPIIGVSIRGSTTGGLPSGADQQGDISPTKVGGYDRVQPKNLNSKIVDGTPNNIEIGQENVPINDNPSTTGGVTHPHQIQVTAHEEPQSVTGASTDSDPTLKLKSASPKGIDVDITEKDGPEGETATDTMQNKQENQMIPATSLSEGKHKAGCKCGFCANRGSFGKKKAETDEGMGEDELSDFDEPDDDEIFPFPKKKPVKKDDKGKKNEKEKKKSELDETFKRHMVLMKEYMAKKCPCGCEPEKCKCPPDCPKCDCNKESVDECATCGCGDPDNKHGMEPTEEKKKTVDEIQDCSGRSDDNVPARVRDSRERNRKLDADRERWDAQNKKDTEKKKESDTKTVDEQQRVDESYSAPFARMRSMAGLGNTILLSNGLMETKHQPGADHPFTTHWKMDKEKAGYVKVDEEKLNKVKAMLERKSKRGSLSETELKLAKRLEEVLKRRQSKQ